MVTTVENKAKIYKYIWDAGNAVWGAPTSVLDKDIAAGE